VQVHPLNERIRELCARAAEAEEAEVEAIFSELQDALREHSRFVRAMTAQTLNRMSSKHAAASKTAD
jgi:hypothetical protein